MSETLTPTLCVICKSDSKNLVIDPDIKQISDLLDYSKRLADLGEADLRPLSDFLSSLSQIELKQIRYHSHCRKKIVNSKLLDRVTKRSASCDSLGQPPKRGRPVPSSTPGRPQRNPSSVRKEKVCIFAQTSCKCDHNDMELHQVTSDNRGQTLLDIKLNTTDDSIRTSLSCLIEPGDARAQEIWYHSNCLRDASRSCDVSENKDDYMMLAISDIQIVMHVKSLLMSNLDTGLSLNMTEINNTYITILTENNIQNVSENYKKRLKNLLTDRIPNIMFVQPPRRNESERVLLSKSLGEAVDYFDTKAPSVLLQNLSDLTAVMRAELLSCRNDWKFSGEKSLSSWKTPPLIQLFLTQLWYGPYAYMVGGTRDTELNKSVETGSQFILQNIHTDRQVKHKPKEDTTVFRRRVETPLSMCLPLAIHHQVRDKSLVSMLSSAYIGSSYEVVMNLLKRVEHAVVLRMSETGGYCLPDFVKKGKTVFFAIDNIDFLEDTAYGQHTLHGSLIVMFQKEDPNIEPVNPALTIPDKPPSTPMHVDINYKDEPIIQLKPIKFDSYPFEQRSSLLTPYYQYDKTWALANHLANVITIPQPETDEADQDVMELDEREDTQTNEEPDNCTSDTDSTILNVTHQVKKQKVLNKSDVMPTWAGTKSILNENTIHQTNSEVVSPLFKRSPTDYSTLYTALALTQNISALVVGPERHTIITLDLDLYERALKIQQSVKNSRWVLRAGELHICFAALHALGKYLEGSGLDTVAIETSIYSPAALRGIYSGKAFKRGVEYHIMNLLACLFLKFDAIIEQGPFRDLLQKKCQKLKDCLHNESEEVGGLYSDLLSHYSENIEPKLASLDVGELAQFLTNYITQVECLLNIISACRQEDWEGYLAALEKQIPYFFAHDLFHYARLMPVHLAQMNNLQTENLATWNALKDGNFCVKKSTSQFSALFADQALEQKIKELKGVGSIVGLTQDEISLDRFIYTLPHITSIVREWKCGFPRTESASSSSKHYQLHGNIALRSTTNSQKLKESIQVHCEGNPFIVQTPLKNIVSSVLIPDTAKEDILNRDVKGLDGYHSFVEDRLIPDSPHSVWDRMKKLKLKTFNTWMAKTRVGVGSKVVKLREERQLLARFLVIQQSRADLLPRLPATIGDYEMSVVPRSMFATDGCLLIPTDKASIIHSIEEAEQAEISSPVANETILPQVPTEKGDTDAEECNLTDSIELCDKVIIIDAMAVVQCMKKTPGMKKIIHFKDAFVKRVERMIKPYNEGRLIFDRYDIVQSLKQKTREKRAKGKEMDFLIHDDMAIGTVPLKELLSSSKTKASLARCLGDAVLEAYKGSKKKIVVVTDTYAHVNQPHTMPESMFTHNHEEADTLIPLHVLDAISESTLREIDVWSPDTDVLILLIDLAAHDRLGAFTKLNFLTGKASKYRSINIPERAKIIGLEKSKGLIGLHNFTGADWGGKFVGISKKTWINAYLSLQNDDPVVSVFQMMGKGILSDDQLVDGNLPHAMQPIEKFLCSVYSHGGPTTIPELRWELFRTRNLEGEKLPPTRATLLPHIQRTNFVAMRDKSYITPHPNLPPLEENGWSIHAGVYVPTMCLNKPAPQSVLELVKCVCKTSCKGRCSCKDNSLPCTALCKCHSMGCSNISDYKTVEDEDDEGE